MPKRHTPSESHIADLQPSIEVAATLAAIDSMQGTLAMARALVLAGRKVELEGLDREAARLCAAVACLPGDSGQMLISSLVGLTREIDALSICLPEP